MISRDMCLDIKQVTMVSGLKFKDTPHQRTSAFCKKSNIPSQISCLRNWVACTVHCSLFEYSISKAIELACTVHIWDNCTVTILNNFIKSCPESYCKHSDPLYMQCKNDTQIRSSETHIRFTKEPIGKNHSGKLKPKAMAHAKMPPHGNHGIYGTTVLRPTVASWAEI